MDQIIQNINHLSTKFETIAVICKTAAECSAVYKQLNNRVDIQLIDHNTKQFKRVFYYFQLIWRRASNLMR